MKFLIADFKIEKYGGIVEHVSAKIKALKSLGHEVDLVQFVPSDISEKTYSNKLKSFANGEFDSKRKFNSEYKGFELDEASGYWKNNYFGFFLPPSNRFNVYKGGTLERWYEFTKDVDIIMWNFMPTKNRFWKQHCEWWRYFDLPERIKQIFTVHDGYFDVRACHVSSLEPKISLLECAHIAAYRCCENIAIPRILMLNPRYIENGKMNYVPMSKREIDFFAAPGFKPMKRMCDFVSAMKYIDSSRYSNLVAGSGIEQSYMSSSTKCKPEYYVSRKNDPDVNERLIGRKMWDVAIDNGMNYVGMLNMDEMNICFENSKFAIDPSYSKHYANYCRTHINGFIIEAILNGCYPVLRDYRGLEDSEHRNVSDLLFDSLEALYISWDATPRQFAEALMSLKDNMTDKKFKKATQKNYEIVNDLFNAKKNMVELIDILFNTGTDCLDKGVDSDNVKRVTDEVMRGYFGIKLPIPFRVGKY